MKNLLIILALIATFSPIMAANRSVNTENDGSSITRMAAEKSTKTKSVEGSIKLRDAERTMLNVKVDGEPVKVTRYTGCYLSRPNRPEDQKINIYIPGNATKQSPIMFIVNNSGWRMNDFPTGTVRDGGDYDGTSSKIGVALKKGWVIVSYGARSRGNGATVEGEYLGHSPSTMTDTKAAIRYLRFNRKALPAGDTERIVITGTSGGGALSTVIAASGNNKDFLPSLYEVGAAGVTRNPDGTFSSEEGIGDNVFAVVSYCPITDLGHADAAYEWLYKDVRKALYLAGKMNYPFADEASINKASDYLSNIYAEYIDTLGLKDENGEALTSTNLSAFIERLMRHEIDLTLGDIGAERMAADVEQEIRRRGPMGGGQNAGAAQHRENNGWIRFNSDGSYDYDLQKHLYYLALYTALKPAPSFSNIGLYGIQMNEDDLFGARDEQYCPFNPYSWDNDARGNKVGKDDTGMTWEEYMATDAGKALALQAKMTCAMDYIIENESDTAPHWYVRHGMDDRDTSFAVEATLFASIMNSPRVKSHNVGFSWLKPHSGDYDIPEAWSWLESILP